MNLTENDISLIRQMIKAGRINVVFDFLPQYNLQKSKAIIESMGNKWCCHTDNSIKKLDAPIEILKEHQSKILRGKA